MLDSTGYLLAWSGYLGATLVILAWWWWLTRRRRGLWRILLRLLPAAWLLAPVLSASHEEWWMPALIVASLGTLVDGLEAGAPGLLALALASLLALALGLAIWSVQRRGRRRRVQASS